MGSKQRNFDLKKDQGKPAVEYIDPEFIIGIGSVLRFGAEKYSSMSFAQGIETSRLYASAMRHLLAWYGGEDNDPESGKSHLYHCASNLMMLDYTLRNNKEKDDRKSHYMENKNGKQ